MGLKPEEMAARAAEEAAWEAGKATREALEARMTEYKEKGWTDPFALIEDILERGIDAVKADRADIKGRNPKG